MILNMVRSEFALKVEAKSSTCRNGSDMMMFWMNALGTLYDVLLQLLLLMSSGTILLKENCLVTEKRINSNIQLVVDGFN